MSTTLAQPPRQTDAPAAENELADERPTPRTLLGRLFRLLSSLLLIAAMLGFLVLAIGPHVLGYRTATMLTGSMAPVIEPGDIVVAVQEPADEVAVGDIISYHIPVEDHRVETHRVIEVIRGDDGSVAVRTQGDANNGADPWTATLEGDHVWEVKQVVPHVGAVIRTLRTPVLHQILLYAGGAVLILSALLAIWGRPTSAPSSSTPARNEAAGRRRRTGSHES